MNKYGRRGIWKLTPFGVEVKKRLVEYNMTALTLAERVQMNPAYLPQILYGKKRGKKYINQIKEVLEIQKEFQEEDYELEYATWPK